MRMPLLVPALLVVALSVGGGAPAAAAKTAGDAYAVVRGPAGIVKAPLFARASASVEVAKVDDEVLTLRELLLALGEVHQARASGTARRTPDFRPALDRLIGTRLVLMEARAMGIDELPEVAADVKQFAESNLRALLQREITRGAKPDRAAVARRYREAVREYRVKSALFAKEEDANEAAAAIRAGSSFEQAIAKAVLSRKAQGGSEVQALSAKVQVLPQVAAAVRALKPGATSGVVGVDKGWAIVKLVGIRHPNDAKARAEAEAQALAQKRAQMLRDEYARLQRELTRTDAALLESLDFEAPDPGFDALAKDTRVLATVEGAGPITVADVCATVEQAFFHGIADAIRQKKLNARARDALESLVSRRVVEIEARRRGLDKSEEHLRAIENRRAEVVFGIFVQKAVAPDVKVTEADGLAYYDEHIREYELPGFYTLSSLGFETVAAAETALATLASGADFNWVKANAQGLLPEPTLAVQFDGNTVTAKSLPPELARALQGARPGDLRLYGAPEGGHYLVAVRQVTAPSPQPYAEVRAAILEKVHALRINAALEQWIERLRGARDVRIYITELTL